MTAIVFWTRNDFSFLGSFLRFAGFAALAMVAIVVLFRIDMGECSASPSWGPWCSLPAVTSCTTHQRAAPLPRRPTRGGFAGPVLPRFALLFWYILQILMSLTSRD